MKVKIVELFQDGVRIPREEALERLPIEGDLLVGFMPVASWGSRSEALAARLRVTYGSRGIMADVIAPLFQPELLCMTRGGFVLRGIQLASDGKSVRHLAQEWWARTVP